MRIIKFIFIFLTFVSSCSDNKPADKTPIKKLSKVTQQLVDSIYIKCNNEVDTQETGLGGEESECYKSFANLLKTASDEELVFLTSHPDTVVRVYAFWGLAKRNYQDIVTVCRQHKNDSTPFVFLDGDAGVIYKVNEFYITILDNNLFDSTCKKLSQTEISELRREFGIK